MYNLNSLENNDPSNSGKWHYKKECLQQYTEIPLSSFLKEIWILSSNPKDRGPTQLSRTKVQETSESFLWGRILWLGLRYVRQLLIQPFYTQSRMPEQFLYKGQGSSVAHEGRPNWVWLIRRVPEVSGNNFSCVSPHVETHSCIYVTQGTRWPVHMWWEDTAKTSFWGTNRPREYLADSPECHLIKRKFFWRSRNTHNVTGNALRKQTNAGSL